MDSVGDGVRRSARLWCHRLAEEEAERYITLPGKKRFKKDSRTWLHKSSKKAGTKKTNDKTAAVKRTVEELEKVIRPVSPIKEDPVLCSNKDVNSHMDGTENKEDFRKKSSFRVIQTRTENDTADTESEKICDSDSFADFIVVKVDDIHVQEKKPLREQHAVLDIDSELCLKAERLALVSSQEKQLEGHSNCKEESCKPRPILQKCETKSLPSIAKGLLESRNVSAKSSTNRHMPAKVTGKRFKKIKLHNSTRSSSIKTRKSKLSSKFLKKRACKQLSKKSMKSKISAKLKKRRLSDETRQRRSSSTCSSVSKRRIKQSSSDRLSKHLARSSLVNHEGDSKIDLRLSRCMELSTNGLHPFITSQSESTIHVKLIGDRSDIALGRSISEAAVVFHSKDQSVHLRTSNSTAGGKSCRSLDRMTTPALSRAASEDAVCARKRKGAFGGHSNTSINSLSDCRNKKSRDSISDTEGRKSILAKLSHSSHLSIIATMKTFSSSESSLKVQCSATTGRLDDTESSASSTVVEQGSVCSIGVSTPNGCLSSSSVDSRTSRTHEPSSNDHLFDLTASPGNHCLSTVNLNNVDLAVEGKFVSAHKLHRTQALATKNLLKDDFEFISRSDSSLL